MNNALATFIFFFASALFLLFCRPGSKELKMQEGESSDEWTTFAGRTNNGLHMVLLFNAKKAASLEPNQILDVLAYFQINRGDILASNTTLYCSKN